MNKTKKILIFALLTLLTSFYMLVMAPSALATDAWGPDENGKCYMQYYTALIEVPCGTTYETERQCGDYSCWDVTTEEYTIVGMMAVWKTYKAVITCSSTCSTTLYTCSGINCDTETRPGSVHVSTIVPADITSAAPSSEDTSTATGGSAAAVSTDSGTDAGLDVPNSSWGNGDWGGDTTETATCDASTDPDKCLSDSSTSSGKIVGILNQGLTILSGAVVISAVIMLIIGGVQYSSAGGNPDGVGAAKKKISNVLIGLLAYVFLYAFLQWLIPGGLVIW